MKNIKPHKIFLIFALLFGTTFAIITPPFQTPDEINHFYRAYQISDGDFTAIKKNNRLGGYIPKSLESFSFQYKKIILNKYCKINFQEIKESKKILLNKNKTKFIDFPNTALYSPFSYIPQSVSIFLLKTFNCKPLYILYITRIISLLFWITIIYFAIKIMPFYKLLFVFLALLPMSLSVNSSLSADLVTNAVSFLFIAFIFKIAFSDKKITPKYIIIIALLATFLAVAKIIYVLLLFLFLIIPIKKFISVKHYFVSFAIIFLFGFGSAFIVKNSIDNLYTPYEKYNPNYRKIVTLGYKANMEKQIDYVLKNKKSTVKVFAKSVFSEFKYMIRSYIGRLGWGDTQLPDFIIILNYIIIFLIAVSSNYEGFKISYKQRIVFILVFILLIIFIMLSQYLTWNKVGSNRVFPFQGRYFIPVFPLFFFLFSVKNKILNFFTLKIIVIISIFFISVFSVNFLYNRFYYNYKLEKQIEINCNSEKLSTDKKYLLTDVDSVKFKNHNFQTNEKAFSSDFSIKLTSNNQFGYSYNFKNIKKGDRFIVSVKACFDVGSIVFQEDIVNGVYFKSSKIINTENDNWYKVETEFFAPKDFIENNLKIYIWYYEKDSAYFDDYKIEYYKKQSL